MTEDRSIEPNLILHPNDFADLAAAAEPSSIRQSIEKAVAVAEAQTAGPLVDLAAAAPEPYLAGDTVVVPRVPGAISAAEYAELNAKQTWDLDELDKMHHYAGIGDWWFSSERRRDLAATIGRRKDRLEALAYECHRLVHGARAAALSVQAPPARLRPITATEYYGAMVGR